MGAPEPVEPVEATHVSGRRIGRYLLRYEIASGGMGEVYLAQMRGPAGVERWIALKVLKPHIAQQQKFVTMFLDEARIASRLSHPNLCAVVDFGESDGRYFLALEYLHGETLSKVVRRVHAEAAAIPGSPIAVDLLTRIIVDAARGLHAAHEARGADGKPLHVVHRDVSPQNVFVLYDGIAKVMDFGIASAQGRESHTTTGEVKGKFAYMSPEQLSGQKVDRRTDVFALGVVFWETLAGRRLFRAESEGETVLNVMTRVVLPPSEHNHHVPAGIDRIVLRALDRDPERRYASAAAMADDIDDYLATVGRPTGPAQVSAMMKRLCADRIITRDAMLRAPQTPLDIVPEIDAESGSSIRTVSSQPEVEVTATPVPRRRFPWAVAGVVIAAVAAAMGIWAVSEAPVSAPPPAPVVAPLAVSAPVPLASPVAVAAPVPVAPPETPSDTPAPAKTKKAAPAASGTLNVMATPGSATVFLRGQRLGTTPLFERRLPAGRHTLRLVPVSGGPEQRVTVEIRPNQLTPLSVRLGR
jgi:serine/threonine protein kinase